MLPFEDGWLPAGWERGGRFYVVNRNFSNGHEMALMVDVELEVTKDEAPAPMHCNVRVHRSQLSHLVRWLAWYCLTPEDLSKALSLFVYRC